MILNSEQRKAIEQAWVGLANMATDLGRFESEWTYETLHQIRDDIRALKGSAA